MSESDSFDHNEALTHSHNMLQPDYESDSSLSFEVESVFSADHDHDLSNFVQQSIESDEMSDHFEEAPTNGHFTDANLSGMWYKVESFRREMMHERNDPDYFPGHSIWTSMTGQEKRTFALNAVQDTLLDQLELIIKCSNAHRDGIVADRVPCFTYPKLSDPKNLKFDKSEGLKPVRHPVSFSRTEWTSSKVRYMRIFLTLDKILNLLKTNTTATKRELYYQNVNEYENQGNLDSAIVIISAMLQIPRVHLHVFATSKGLIAGSLQYRNEDEINIDCSCSVGGELIPQNVEKIFDLSTKAKMIFVVEKDATFQKLLQDPFMTQNAILITAKGMPDLNTRQFLRRLWLELGLPVFGIFDADPYGLEIMLVYRFGSRVMAWCAEPLAVPQMRWLGIHPSDFEHLDQALMVQLSRMDHSKLKSIMDREYVRNVPRLKEELDIILSSGFKAEIQNISLLSHYICDKLTREDWV